MQFSNVAIQGLAYVDAPIRVTSDELEDGFAATLERLGSPRGLVEKLTGVKARRFFDEGVQPSTAATAAARLALADADIDPARVEIIISTSVCKDYIEPSIASTVHGNLGLASTCLNFDVGNACLAFLNAMDIIATMIERGRIDYGLVVDGENSRFAVESTVKRLAGESTTDQDLRDEFATLTLGSGGAAMVLCRADLATTEHRFVGGLSLAATEHNHLCHGQPDKMTTDATGLLKAGVELAQRTYQRAQETLGWQPEELDLLVMHQVGSVHSSTILRSLGLDQQIAHLIYPEFGNIGPASIPITLAKAAEAGKCVDGDRIALMGIGSGLNCAMMEVQW